MGKAIAAAANFEVDPTVTVSTRQLVLFNEFCWDVCDFDADILRIGHWGIKVEVLEVNGAESRTVAREHTVEEHLEEFEGRGFSANISRVTNTTASDGDAGTIRIVFIGSHFTHYHGVADFLSFVRGDVTIVDEKEGVSARNSFGGGGGSRPNSLTQSSELVGVGSVPCCLVAWIATEFAVLEEFTSGWIQHRQCLGHV